MFVLFVVSLISAARPQSHDVLVLVRVAGPGAPLTSVRAGPPGARSGAPDRQRAGGPRHLDGSAGPGARLAGWLEARPRGLDGRARAASKRGSL